MNRAANTSLRRATEITLNIERKLNNSQRKVPKFNFTPADKTVFNLARKKNSDLSDKIIEQQNKYDASDRLEPHCSCLIQFWLKWRLYYEVLQELCN